MSGLLDLAIAAEIIDKFSPKKKILANGWTGKIPIYSSKTEDKGLMIKIDERYLESKDDLYYQHCLTWATDGYAGTLYVRNEDNVDNKKKGNLPNRK